MIRQITDFMYGVGMFGIGYGGGSLVPTDSPLVPLISGIILVVWAIWICMRQRRK